MQHEHSKVVEELTAHRCWGGISCWRTQCLDSCKGIGREARRESSTSRQQKAL